MAAGAAGLPCELLVCPPYVHLAAVAQALAGSPVALGGQDCHQAKQGAHTGDISAPMLRDVGATWVILGHSERRQNHGETDELVREKVLAAVEAGLTPIVCVGETADQRAGGQETEVVGWQLAGSLPKPFAGVVAYEPVWAIGTGKNATDAGRGHHARVHPRGAGAAVRRGRAGHPHPVWRLGAPGQRRLAAGGAACRRRAGRRRQPEGGGLPGDCPSRTGGLASRLVPPAAGEVETRQLSRVRGQPHGCSVRLARVTRVAPLRDLSRRRRERCPNEGPRMTTVLLIIHLFVTLALIGVVLIQRSEGGGLGIGSSQGMGSFMSGRGTANLLTRTTAILATIFMALSLTLALLNRGTMGAGGRSILDTGPPASAPGPAGAPPAGHAPLAPAPAVPAKPSGPSVPSN